MTFSFEEMEMHPIPQSAIFTIAFECGCYPLEVHCDTWVQHKDMASQSFVLKKVRL